MNSRVYHGEVSHTRVRPVRHGFQYPVYFFAFDLDELPELAARTALFGYNRIRPVAIHDRDYLLPGNAPLREKLAEVLARNGRTLPAGQVILVTAARYFHYVFNPISFFYCFDAGGHLDCVLVQVNNTFGEMHLYLLQEILPAETGNLRFRADKQFHVSPFFEREGYYEFRLTPPGEQLDNLIRYHRGGELALVARLQGQATPLTPASLRRTLLSYPLSASLTMPRILWQAARLYWQRRLPVYRKPVPDSPMTVRPVPPGLPDRLGMAVVRKFLARLPDGELTLVYPDGHSERFGRPGSTPAVRLTVHEYRFFRRIMFVGDIGFGEGYTAGDWSTDDLPGLLTLLATHQQAMDDHSIASAAGGRLLNYLRHLGRANTVRGSRRNIRAHYDESNAFFATFLDPTMTYSCALFDTAAEDLESAQRRKLNTLMDKADLTADDHVLEIGCGWGSFALEAVRRTGCRVTGITVSQEQLALAQERVRAAGLEEKIDLRLTDYRHVDGQFTKLVSIEMLEAVGHAGLGSFFAACDRALEPGGRAVIQVIIIRDDKYRAYRAGSDWIRKHVFPGGHLPSLEAMQEAIAQHSTLQVAEVERFGSHYVQTLDRWRETLLGQAAEVRAMGYDEAFLRRWEYYFAYCRAGFATGLIDLVQMVLTKPAS